MLTVIIIFFSIQSNLACLIEFCEHCSVFSENICINCDLGYHRDLSQGCVKSTSRELLIENCKIADKNNCLICEAGFILLNDRCYPQCSEACECSELNVCKDVKSLQRLRILRSRRSSSGRSSGSVYTSIFVPIAVCIVFVIFIIWLRTYLRRRRLRRLQALGIAVNPAFYQNGYPMTNNGAGIIIVQNDPSLINSTALYEHQPIKAEPLHYNQFAPGSMPTNLIEITLANFNTTVPFVQIDQNFMINGEKVCRLCGTEYNPKFDHRILPCRHVFHGECIYNWLLVRNFKYCPIDQMPFK